MPFQGFVFEKYPKTRSPGNAFSVLEILSNFDILVDGRPILVLRICQVTSIRLTLSSYSTKNVTFLAEANNYVLNMIKKTLKRFDIIYDITTQAY